MVALPAALPVLEIERPALHKGQREAFNHPARFRVLACGRRWGKTMLGATIAGCDEERGALFGKAPVWWVSPTYKVGTIAWRLLKRLYRPVMVDKSETERRIGLISGQSIWAKSADEPDSLRGEGLGLVVIDECAFVQEAAWQEALRPALADQQGKAVFISTPKGHNWFWRAYQRGVDPHEPDWAAWSFPTSSNPYIAPEEIEEARGLLPDRVFRQEFLAEFVADAGGVFRGVDEAATAEGQPGPIPGRRYVMGVDWGRVRDFTVLAVLDATAHEMVEQDRFNQVAWQLQRDRLVELARKWRCDLVLAETNAMGEPNVEAIARILAANKINVRGFTTTAASKPGLIEGLSLAIERSTLKLLPDPVLLGELKAYEYETMPSGRSRYSAPEGAHDDTVIALALAWEAACRKPRGSFKVTRYA